MASAAAALTQVGTLGDMKLKGAAKEEVLEDAKSAAGDKVEKVKGDKIEEATTVHGDESLGSFNARSSRNSRR